MPRTGRSSSPRWPRSVCRSTPSSSRQFWGRATMPCVGARTCRASLFSVADRSHLGHGREQASIVLATIQTGWRLESSTVKLSVESCRGVELKAVPFVSNNSSATAPVYYRFCLRRLWDNDGVILLLSPPVAFCTALALTRASINGRTRFGVFANVSKPCAGNDWAGGQLSVKLSAARNVLRGRLDDDDRVYSDADRNAHTYRRRIGYYLGALRRRRHESILSHGSSRPPQARGRRSIHPGVFILCVECAVSRRAARGCGSDLFRAALFASNPWVRNERLQCCAMGGSCGRAGGAGLSARDNRHIVFNARELRRVRIRLDHQSQLGGGRLKALAGGQVPAELPAAVESAQRLATHSACGRRSLGS